MKSLSVLSLSLICLLLNLGVDNDMLSKVGSHFSSEKNKKIESHIEYAGFLDLCKEVESHRAERLIDWKTFLKYAKDPNTIILDTRSRDKYNLSHIDGAVNLPFSEFTSRALYKATGYNTENRVLIYCNNNFIGDPISFALKGPAPILTKSKVGIDSGGASLDPKAKSKEVLLKRYKEMVGNGPSLALNIPTYITLYGYGFENVYELGDLLHIRDEKVKEHLVSNTDETLYIDGIKVAQNLFK